MASRVTWVCDPSMETRQAWVSYRDWGWEEGAGRELLMESGGFRSGTRDTGRQKAWHLTR